MQKSERETGSEQQSASPSPVSTRPHVVPELETIRILLETIYSSLIGLSALQTSAAYRLVDCFLSVFFLNTKNSFACLVHLPCTASLRTYKSLTHRTAAASWGRSGSAPSGGRMRRPEPFDKISLRASSRMRCVYRNPHF